MKRASGKSNLSIIKDYVEGNRPFTQISMAGSDELKKRKEGEEWEDGAGKKWKKQSGKKVAINNIKTIVLDAVKESHICRICNTDTRFSSKNMQRYDNQVVLKTGKCYDCFVEFETVLKSKGLYDAYIRRRDLKYLRGYLKDFKTKLEDTINWCNSPSSKKLESFTELGPEMVEMEVEHDNTDRIDVIKADATKDLELISARLIEVNDELDNKIFDEDEIIKIDADLKKKYKKGRTNSEFRIKMGKA